MRRAFLTCCLLCVVASSAGASALRIEPIFAPPEQLDPADLPGDPLDVLAVAFGQHDTQLWLKIRTQAAWSAAALQADSMCLLLSRSRIVGRVCVESDDGAVVLRYHRVAANGVVGRERRIPAAIVRDSQATLFASFAPRSVSLPLGPVSWSFESRWRANGRCAATCVDRVPNSGDDSTPVSVLAQPRCFGAAARATTTGCDNPAFSRAVIPSPDDALLTPDSPCQPLNVSGAEAILHPCRFGAGGEAKPAALLIGDSHAHSLRGAVDVVAQARRWSAISMTQPGCAFSTDLYPAPAPAPQRCRQRNSEAIRWLSTHPSVHTVFTTSSTGRGLPVGGFDAMWSQVPASVTRIYEIRDVPRVRVSTGDCVRGVARAHRPSTGACAVPRSAGVLADPAFTAVAAAPARVHGIDLTRFFCDASQCFPVIGGAYVYVDDNHINATFAQTLGPFLLRELH